MSRPLSGVRMWGRSWFLPEAENFLAKVCGQLSKSFLTLVRTKTSSPDLDGHLSEARLGRPPRDPGLLSHVPLGVAPPASASRSI